MRAYVLLLLLLSPLLIVLSHALPNNIINNNNNNNNAIGTVILTAGPAVLTTKNNQLTIKWMGVANATGVDFISIYSPSTSQPIEEIGWVLLSSYAGWESGSGYYTLPLVNMRQDYVFRLWNVLQGPPPSNSVTRKAPFADITNSTFILSATSNIVTFQSPNEPLHGRLALTNDPSQMRVMWVSGTPDNTTKTACTVRYGIDAKLSQLSTGITYTYTLQDMCAAPANTSAAWRDPGYIHDVLLTNLAPSTLYYYQYGSEGSGWSDVMQFTSAPKVGASSEAFVVAFGDLGVGLPFATVQEQQTPAPATAQHITDLLSGAHTPFAGYQQTNPSWVVLHVGDISYARGWSYLWDYFAAQIQPVATKAPYMVCIGNHEYDFLGQPFKPVWSTYHNDSGGECGIPYGTRFNMPNPAGLPTSQRNLWYSFNNGPIHFVFMSTEHDFLVGSPQYNFIANDLAYVDKTVTPWIVFSGHRPMYSSGASGMDFLMFAEIRETYEPLLRKYKVQLALWGHVHVYERTCGMYNYTCMDNDNDGTVHVIIGMAGNTFGTPWLSPNQQPNGNGEMPEPDWSVFRTGTYGYTRFYANSTHLYFQYITNPRNEIHDSFWLTTN